MVKEDLLEHAKSSIDFYELLGVAFETSESDIRRAYRRTALKYHPDKLGKDFDPEKFHLLQIANDVLSDPSAKAAYDNARNARLQKSRQNELLEGKRRQMKEDLEAKERGNAGPSHSGVKRPREENEMDAEIRRLAEEGRRRRAEMEQRLRSQAPLQPETTKESTPAGSRPANKSPIEVESDSQGEEDEVARLERRIREMQEAKVKRKADKKARKSGMSVPVGQTAKCEKGSKSPQSGANQAMETPSQRPDLFKDLKADQRSSASTKFSSSPRTAAGTDEFTVTMERLKVAERKRLEDEIRKKEANCTP